MTLTLRLSLIACLSLSLQTAVAEDARYSSSPAKRTV